MSGLPSSIVASSVGLIAKNAQTSAIIDHMAPEAIPQPTAIAGGSFPAVGIPMEMVELDVARIIGTATPFTAIA